MYGANARIRWGPAKTAASAVSGYDIHATCNPNITYKPINTFTFVTIFSEPYFACTAGNEYSPT